MIFLVRFNGVVTEITFAVHVEIVRRPNGTCTFENQQVHRPCDERKSYIQKKTIDLANFDFVPLFVHFS